MVKFTAPKNGLTHRKKPRRAHTSHSRYKKLARMGKTSVGIINELCRPIDTINRFINLTLQTIGENSQGREFLIESKKGIRDTSLLLKKLNNHAKRIEREIREISTASEQS